MILLFACGHDVREPAASASESPFVALAAPRLLRRASLDVRGVLPTSAELDAVEADPSAIDAALDALPDDPRFEERLVALFAQSMLTRVDTFDVSAGDYGFAADQDHAFVRSVGEEPLRLMARVAADDRPWSDIVSADHTMANELLAAAWGLDYREGATGWQEARYVDGSRPPASSRQTASGGATSASGRTSTVRARR